MLSGVGPRTRLNAAISMVALCFLASAWLAGYYENTRHRLADEAVAQSQAEAKRASAAIDVALNRIMGHIQEVADDLHAGKVGRESLDARLRNTLYSDPDMAEIGVAFKPFAWSPGIRLHGVAYTLSGHDIVQRMLDTDQDYTSGETAWYTQPLGEHRPLWIMPQRLKTSGARVAIYALPFRLPGAEQESGVVYAAYALERLNGILDTLKLGEADFAYVLTEQGALLAHPNRDYIENPGKFVQPDTTKVHAGIPAINGSLVVTASQPMVGSPRTIRRILAGIALTLGIGILLLVIGAAQFDRIASRRSWIISIACSITFLSVVIFVLVLAGLYPERGSVGGVPIPNQSVLNRFVTEQDRKVLSRGQPLPLPLPTGIMVQSITFLSGKDLRVTGYVWQRYRKGLHDGVTRGFLIPESDSFTASEIYREKHLDGEVIGWSFNALLHVEFDNRYFPFDVQNIRIPLWPKDFYRSVLLVPDLDAYPLSMPDAKPGLRRDLVIPNWNIETAVFDYVQRTYKSNFGFGETNAPANLPELGLTISGSRQVSGPFITYLLPVAVVMVMLFSLLILSNRDEKRMKFLGFDAAKVITACGGFFLVVIFSEIDLRKTLATRDIVYLEYFHFTAYTAILAVAISAIIFAYDKCETHRNHDNYNVKRIYWPMVLLLILLFTMLTFI